MGSSPKSLLPSWNWSYRGAKENTFLTCLYPKLMICGWSKFNRPIHASQSARNIIVGSTLRCNSLPLGWSHPLLGKSKQTKSKTHDGERKQKRKCSSTWLGSEAFPEVTQATKQVDQTPTWPPCSWRWPKWADTRMKVSCWQLRIHMHSWQRGSLGRYAEKPPL